MAFTTATGLISTLVGMSVSGFASTSKFAYPPELIDDAMMPILYVRTPVVSRELSTLGYAQGLKMGVAEVVILIGAMTMDLQSENLANAATYEDALSTALEANAALLGMDKYSIALEGDTVGGDVPYWALVATVEVSG